ncbi:MAG: PHP domain-containing protein [Alphaproteobacteria bacterium]|nr:PHP domain-containing protein [Alphaproteobacteria bacterium]
MQKFSYHTHTDFSDGKNTIEEMLEQACLLGWHEIGISDHLIIHKNIMKSPSWEIRWQNEPHIYNHDFKTVYENFARHVEHIRKVAENYPLKVRIGAEVDFFPYSQWLDEFALFREKLPLDYYISGNHYLFLDEKAENIIDMKDAEIFPLNEQEIMIKRHFKTLGQAAESKIFAFIAHLDYVRKVDLFLQNDFREEKQNLAKILSQSHTATELSTKGLRRSNDFYPDRDFLNLLIKNGVQFVISDDAHRINELGYHFDEAEKQLSDFNCRNRWNYQE